MFGAVSCALELQQQLAASELDFRIGVNLGDVIDDGEDIHGEGVNIAARLEALAEPGGICISGGVYEQVRNRIEPVFEDGGEHRVKHVTAPVRVWRWPAGQAVVPEPDPVEADGDLSLPDKPSIAVLPFDNIGGDPEQEYFSDGVTEDIITELSRISGLFVIARHSTFSYKGQVFTLPQVARDLGVRYILEGSVRRAANRLRVSSQLIDSSSGHCLWAERYDRDLEDIFAVQGEVAQNVAEALQVVLQPDENERIKRPPTDNIEAYDIYLQIRSSLWPPTRENLLTARSAYRRIADIDPGFAGGHAGQSLTYSLTSVFGLSEKPAQDAERAAQLAARALELDPGFAPAHSAAGLACTAAGEHDEAISRARRGVDLHPGDADSHLFLAFATLFGGDPEAAYDAINTALRLDPKYVRGPYLNILGITCFVSGRYAEAIDVFQRNIDRGGPIGPPALAFRTAALAVEGRKDAAQESVRELLGFFPGFTLSGFNMLRVFRDADVMQRTLSALRETGLPE